MQELGFIDHFCDDDDHTELNNLGRLTVVGFQPRIVFFGMTATGIAG
jgi:hypothetical protein